MLMLAAALFGAHVAAQVRPGGDVAACVDLARRARSVQWLRIVPLEEPCRTRETRMSVLLLRDELFAVTAPEPDRSRAPAAKRFSSTILEGSAYVPGPDAILIVTSVLVQNDGARFTIPPRRTDGDTQDVAVRCAPFVDAQQAGRPLHLSLAVRPPQEAPTLTSLPDLLGSTVNEHHAIGDGAHRFAVTCAIGRPVAFRGTASLIVLQY